jgi:TBC1 domain family member 2
MVSTLRELITRIDGPLAKHLNEEGIEFIQFSFRWMNCLLMREFTVKNVIRMWDTYAVWHLNNSFNIKSEGQKGFSEFHVYVCAALLDKYSSQILTMDFQVANHVWN